MDDTPAGADARRLEDHLEERRQKRAAKLGRRRSTLQALAQPVLEELAQAGWCMLPPCLKPARELKRDFTLRRKAEANGNRRVVHRFQVGSEPNEWNSCPARCSLTNHPHMTFPRHHPQEEEEIMFDLLTRPRALPGVQKKVNAGTPLTEIERMKQITPVIFPPVDAFYDLLEQKLPGYGPYARGDQGRVLCAFLDADVHSLFTDDAYETEEFIDLVGEFATDEPACPFTVPPPPVTAPTPAPTPSPAPTTTPAPPRPRPHDRRFTLAHLPSHSGHCERRDLPLDYCTQSCPRQRHRHRSGG